MATVKNCCICHRKNKENHMLQSDLDEYFCKECFKYQYCAVSKKKKHRSKHHAGDAVVRPKKMFSPIDLVLLERISPIVDDSKSKRPLQCPHPSCRRYVSVFDLNAHFQHEHSNVTQGAVDLDDRKSATLNPRALEPGVKKCLLLLTIQLPPPAVVQDSDKDEKTPPPLKPPEKKVPVPLPPIAVVALAARLVTSATIEDGEVPLPCEGDEMVLASNEKLIFWLASNINTNLCYTVAASTARGDIRVKYYGPMPQLNYAPMQIYKEGYGLVLNHYQFAGMTEKGLRALALDVIVHSDD